MKKKLFLFPSLLALCLTSCAGAKHYDAEKYTLELDYKDNFRILQLTDTHIGDKDNTPLHYEFMDLTINEAHPDLIVITGDVFTFASKHTAKEFFAWLDGHNIPWTLTWGNHDEQCFFSIDWVTDLLNNYGKNCKFIDLQDDDVQGNANFVINLKEGGAVFEQLVIMDSNRYNYNGYFGYDYFKQNQIDWYSRVVKDSIPSLMFYHIPLKEINDVWEAAQKDKSLIVNPEVGENKEDQREDPCNPDFNSGFFKEITKKKSTHGMYFGHDHINNYIIRYEVEEGYKIDFGYGIKATDRVYAEDEILGGRVIVLHHDHSLTYEDFYHTYSEVK